MCSTGNGRVKELAEELRRLTAGFFKVFPPGHGDFDWDQYRKGLDYFCESYGCPTCLGIEDPWCEVLKCEKVEEKGSCLVCAEFLECPRTEYQRDRYPFVIVHYRRVAEKGLEALFEEEREKAESGVLLQDIRRY